MSRRSLPCFKSHYSYVISVGADSGFHNKGDVEVECKSKQYLTCKIKLPGINLKVDSLLEGVVVLPLHLFVYLVLRFLGRVK